MAIFDYLIVHIRASLLMRSNLIDILITALGMKVLDMLPESGARSAPTTVWHVIST